MAVNSKHFAGLTPEDVFRVLVDGDTYADWVVGTRKIREVADDWPTPGASIHYTVGHLPVHIELRVEPSTAGRTVILEEGPKRGLLKTFNNPLLDLVIKARNVETLRRLEKKTRVMAVVADC